MTARDDTVPHRVVLSGIVSCPGCGRPQTTDPRTGRPTPHATMMGGSQLCAGVAPTGRPS